MIDEDVRRLLHDAAGRTAVTSQLDEVLADAVVVPVRAVPTARPRRRWIPAAASLVLLAAAGALVVTRDEPVSGFAGPPAPVPAGAPAPGTVAAYLADAPAWVGELGAARRTGGERTGTWVLAALGVVDGDEIRRPITVAAYDGTFVRAGSARPVEVAGTPYRSLRIGGWEALFTVGEPTIVVTGPDEADLAAVVRSAHAAYVGGRLTLTLDDTPDGYTLVVPPQTLAEDPRDRPTLASGTAFGIHEVSDQVDPLLSAAGSGNDLRATEVGEVTGWYFRTSSAQGPLAALTWSPRPGVVFELVTSEVDRSPRELAALAARVEVVPVDEWEDRLGG